MYKIIGADQKEYGPITADQVRQWIAEGRANGQTQARLDDGPWKPLSTFPEFAQTPGASPAAPPLQGGLTAGMGGMGGTRESALQQVSGPAIGLLVTAILGLMGAVAGLAMNILGIGFSAAGMSGNPETERWVHLFGGTLGILGNIVAILVGVFLLYAGLKIRKLENYNAGLIGSIIAMVPCISPCCLIGLPVGIWALVILNRPEVKSHFQ